MTTLLLGLLIGAALGLTGAGGGVLAVPLLMAGTHAPLAVVAPVALTAVAMAAGLGAVLAWRAQRVRYRAAALMAAVGIAASPAGLWLAQRLPAAPLALAFAAVLGWVAWSMWRRGAQPGSGDAGARMPCRLDTSTGRLFWTLPCARALAAMGAAAGALSGLLGVGGGFVIVPGLHRFTDMPMEAAIGTSLAVVALVSAWGVAASAAMGHLDAPLAWRFALGAAGGMLAARRVAPHVPASLLQRGFAVLAAGIALSMAWTALHS
ncbi:sulfite exporter TauE/SafE family protein [Xylophilus sp. GW821-FHT01B05]